MSQLLYTDSSQEVVYGMYWSLENQLSVRDILDGYIGAIFIGNKL